MLHRREISPDMHYWSEGLEKWQRVAELSDQPSG
jgi:hypothetical protein